MTTLANIQAQQAQQTSVLLQQISQTQQPSTSNTIAQIFAAAQHQQAQQQANLFQQLQAQQATSSNSTTQLLANIQQQQQAQSNQMMSMLQQYQQSATNFNPYQNAQQNQQMLDLLSQTQSGGAPPVDWANLANASGMDPNMLMSMMMGGMDPTNIAIQERCVYFCETLQTGLFKGSGPCDNPSIYLRIQAITCVYFTDEFLSWSRRL
ncbi:hypothetical protein AG1IA_05425 [Rhizoctonia solani AG-1 IA]|uniref:Uncharacterized protein n=1 Tax=Thanatephorus cucumeris (strain AG1-IA) TaxID=983506 RepID=L8WUS7_THACA|nr:hypothetical protein AG1IA_05425 [Rhizoctonia solani AG-1 IA]